MNKLNKQAVSIPTPADIINGTQTIPEARGFYVVRARCENCRAFAELKIAKTVPVRDHARQVPCATCGQTAWAW